MELKTNDFRKLTITFLRLAVGWHFLYEGIWKLLNDGWTSQVYLLNSTGFLSGFYHRLAESQALTGVVDFLNVYGLILMGLALFIGVFVRLVSVFGILLLLLYYFAYPPFGTSLFG
ncbi:unnamed protein product, partial [marine sediment metagenome]